MKNQEQTKSEFPKSERPNIVRLRRSYNNFFLVRISDILTFGFILAMLYSFCFGSPAEAQKIIRKTVRKIVKPSIAPTPAPKITTSEVVPVPPPPPPPPPSYEVETPGSNKGLFGWGLNTDLSGAYAITSGQTGLLGMLGARGDIVFADPLKLGSRIGLAEDALEYKVGLGYILGNDNSNNPLNSFPLYADAVLHLKEGSLWGLDPYVGLGVNFNLIGTNATSGGTGSQIYGGALVDFGSAAGKTGITISYNTLNVGTIRSASGISFGITQPFIL